jgi:hypothetical protein
MRWQPIRNSEKEELSADGKISKKRLRGGVSVSQS